MILLYNTIVVESTLKMLEDMRFLYTDFQDKKYMTYYEFGNFRIYSNIMGTGIMIRWKFNDYRQREYNVRSG